MFRSFLIVSFLFFFVFFVFVPRRSATHGTIMDRIVSPSTHSRTQKPLGTPPGGNKTVSKIVSHNYGIFNNNRAKRVLFSKEWSVLQNKRIRTDFASCLRTPPPVLNHNTCSFHGPVSVSSLFRSSPP